VSIKLAALGFMPPTGDLQGVLVVEQTTRLTDITDGTSNTIMVTEDAGRPELWNAGKKVPGYANGGPWASRQGPFAMAGSSLDGSIPIGYCPMNCTNDNEIYAFHGAGANALFADCSVQFIHSSIDISNMAALITRSGGEVNPGTDYCSVALPANASGRWSNLKSHFV
jgi:prepilin-type processing-associated H-X9-DG protein